MIEEYKLELDISANWKKTLLRISAVFRADGLPRMAGHPGGALISDHRPNPLTT
jgi:hypothetical protein